MLSLLAVLLATPLQPLPVVFHVPQVQGRPTVDADWLKLRLGETNRVFKPHGVQFVLRAVRPLGIKHRLADRRGQRDALALLNEPGVINVYVVDRLMDIHQRLRLRQGVHWKVRRRGHKRRIRYVIMAAYAVPGVLAHELGHYLGHSKHSKVADNLMSYNRTGKRAPFLSKRQGRAMARRARGLINRGVIKP